VTANMSDRLFLTVAEFAELYRTDVRSVRRGIACGEIPAVQVGRIYRIPVPKVRELLGLPPIAPESAGAA
jgi:excisionase family DNA binding protein